MPTPTAAHLVDSGTRTITHAIGASTSLSVGAGSYGRGAIVVAIVAGQSGFPLPNTTHHLEVVANAATYDFGTGGASGGGTLASLRVEAAGTGSNPATLDAGFTLRFRSPTSTFAGVLAYAFFTAPVDFPSQLVFQNGSANEIPDAFAASDGGTVTISTNFGEEFGGPTAVTYGSKGGYALHLAGGIGVFGTTAADWTGQPGWVNAARAINTNGEVSIGFCNQTGLLAVPWSMSGAPYSEVNSASVSILFDILGSFAGTRGTHSFAQVIG